MDSLKPLLEKFIKDKERKRKLVVDSDLIHIALETIDEFISVELNNLSTDKIEAYEDCAKLLREILMEAYCEADYKKPNIRNK